MIDVTAAIIKSNDKYLICQRPLGKGNALLWEFPGGKIEKGETLADCLKRECFEELDIKIGVGKLISTKIYEYPDITVNVHFFEAFVKDDMMKHLKMNVHKSLLWVSKEELKNFEFCPADKDIIELLSK